MGSIPGQGIKIPQATWYSQKKNVHLQAVELWVHSLYLIFLNTKN